MKLADVIQMRNHEGGGEPIFMKSARKMLSRMRDIKRDTKKTDNTSMPTGWNLDPHTGGAPNSNLRMDGVSG